VLGCRREGRRKGREDCFGRSQASAAGVVPLKNDVVRWAPGEAWAPSLNHGSSGGSRPENRPVPFTPCVRSPFLPTGEPPRDGVSDHGAGHQSAGVPVEIVELVVDGPGAAGIPYLYSWPSR